MPSDHVHVWQLGYRDGHTFEDKDSIELNCYGYDFDKEEVCHSTRELPVIGPPAPELARLRELLHDGIEAMRLTREYVGEKLLPEIPGWSWYDWTQRVEAALAPEGDSDASNPRDRGM